ncbi:MAG: alkaline phosphatase family protein [Aliidiomarina sp.]|uniref:alkaline phosphatase family protein n=1 Tax=Aliidiomarina sp. TaxID=1872439 RepID=UPI0025C2EF97|nr:alkaline phosphatase family protein [Aliidiomarina sp.]MCH8501727.1 alkaline phosphatase family protein [Aliidiomarina sp.]
MFRESFSFPSVQKYKTLLGALALAGLVGCAAADQTQQVKTPVPAEERRALLVSIDSLNEAILKNSLTRDEVPNFYRLFEHGACTEFAQPTFPSVTAAGHSALWTGTFGDVSQITGNTAHRLPRDQNTVMNLVSGYESTNSAAEPIWATAALNGRSAGGHHVTQAPQVPGFPARVGQPSAQALADQARISAAYEQNNLTVMNGYNIQVNFDAALRADDVEWLTDSRWENPSALGIDDTHVSPRYFRWQNRAGTFYGVFYGDEQYDRIAVNTSPDGAGAIVAVAHPVEDTPPQGRELARYFSEPLAVTTAQGETFLRLRLFTAAADGSDFLLYHPAMLVMDINNQEQLAQYNAQVRGWFGNSSTRLYSRGGFGAPLFENGDGTAEARYLETAELATRLFNKGSAFFWNELGVDLLVDYFPMGDSIDHTISGYMAAESPYYNPDVAARARDLRTRTWQLVDLRLQHLMQLTQGPESALFVGGDHGMRPSWQSFLPNVLLQEAGLQFLDDNGMVDLSRSLAVSPNASWITVNTQEWRRGIVAEEDKANVIDRIVAALENLRDGDGNRVIERVYIASEHPELGIGGAAGGDVYWDTVQGYAPSRSVTGASAIDVNGRISAGHSHASTNPDMYTVTCAYGQHFPANRIPGSRLIDMAPTVADYLAIPAPKHSRGESLYQQLRGE